MRRKDVRKGDTVIVRRAGDVIPEIVGPVLVQAQEERAALVDAEGVHVVRHAARAPRGRGRLPVPEQARVPLAGHRVAVPLRGARRDGHRAPRLHDRDAPARGGAHRGPRRHLRARRRQALAAAGVQGQGHHERARSRSRPRRTGRSGGCWWGSTSATSARTSRRCSPGRSARSTRSPRRARTRSTPCPRSAPRSPPRCGSGSTTRRTWRCREAARRRRAHGRRARRATTTGPARSRGSRSCSPAASRRSRREEATELAQAAGRAGRLERVEEDVVRGGGGEPRVQARQGRDPRRRGRSTRPSSCGGWAGCRAMANAFSGSAAPVPRPPAVRVGRDRGGSVPRRCSPLSRCRAVATGRIVLATSIDGSVLDRRRRSMLFGARSGYSCDDLAVRSLLTSTSRWLVWQYRVNENLEGHRSDRACADELGLGLSVGWFVPLRRSRRSRSPDDAASIQSSDGLWSRRGRWIAWLVVVDLAGSVRRRRGRRRRALSSMCSTERAGRCRDGSWQRSPRSTRGGGCS